MKFLFISITFLVVWSINVFSQDYISYYKNKYLAEYYIKKGENDSAAIFLDKAIDIMEKDNKFYQPLFLDYMYRSKLYLLKNDTILFIKTIHKTCPFLGTLERMHSSSVMSEFDFTKIHEMPEWKEVSCNCKKQDIGHNDSINKVIGKLVDDDFMVRMSGTDEEILYTDSINRVILFDIVDKYGWPGIHLVGDNSFFMILVHSPFSFKSKYFDELKKEVLKGNLMPHNYASLVDDAFYDADQKIIYGAIKHTNLDSLIIDMDTVRKNRKELGLISYEKQLELRRLKLEKEKQK